MSSVILSILDVVKTVLPDVLRSTGAKNVDMARINAELHSKILEADSAETQAIISNLNKQIEMNIAETQAGKVGWRNWLGIILTIAAGFNLFVRFLPAFLYLFGLSPGAAKQFIALLPQDLDYMLWPNLMALAGIYVARGKEKIQYLDK